MIRIGSRLAGFIRGKDLGITLSIARVGHGTAGLADAVMAPAAADLGNPRRSMRGSTPAVRIGFLFAVPDTASSSLPETRRKGQRTLVSKGRAGR
jgi:hypothetical protein